MTEQPAEVMPPSLDQLATALAAFQAAMPRVVKAQTATIPGKDGRAGFSYKYAGLAELSEATMPLLAEHGLSFVTLPGNGQLTGILLHSSGQSLTASLPVGTGTPQQIGSALTYMRRYLLGCMTGVVTDDDDDGQMTSSAKRARPKAAPAEQRPEPGSGQVSPQQIRMLGALMSKAGMSDRTLALQFVADQIGRTVESRNDLTSREASLVIDALKAIEPTGEAS